MRKKLGVITLTLCSILFFTLLVSAAVYTLKDKDGNTVVSSSPPPPDVNSQKVGQPSQKQVNGNQRSYSDIKVLLYRTSWCPYCKQAREYLTSLGVNLIEYDIEQDSEKHAEMRNKGGTGVPLVDVEGIILKGFSEHGIREAVDKRRSGG